MKILFHASILLSFLLLIGCSSGSPKATSSHSDKSGVSVETTLTPPRSAMVGDVTKTLNFPITQSNLKLSSIHYSSIFNGLRHSLILYTETFGQMPSTLDEYIESGFPIIWPRNVKNGNPVQIIESDELQPSEQYFGFVEFSKTDSTEANIKCIGYDLANSNNFGEDRWEVRSFEFSTIPNIPDSYPAHSEYSTTIWVNGGTVSVASISDPQKRLLYTQFGQLSSFIEGQTNRYYNYENVFPSSFDDLYDAKQFFIEENLAAFQNLLMEFDVDFKWGFDNNTNENYIWLEVDDEVLISGCTKYSTTNKTPFPHQCNPEETDMSSPLLTTEMLLELEIPEDYVISITNINSISNPGVSME